MTSGEQPVTAARQTALALPTVSMVAVCAADRQASRKALARLAGGAGVSAADRQAAGHPALPRLVVRAARARLLGELPPLRPLEAQGKSPSPSGALHRSPTVLDARCSLIVRTNRLVQRVVHSITLDCICSTSEGVKELPLPSTIGKPNPRGCSAGVSPARYRVL